MILDTHVAIWLRLDLQIEAQARRDIERASERGMLRLSAISAWEVATLIRLGRLHVTMPTAEYIGRLFHLPGVREVPVTREVAQIAGELSDVLHGDPADRIIVATAAHLGIPLVTRDERILRFAKSHGGFACIAA